MTLTLKQKSPDKSYATSSYDTRQPLSQNGNGRKASYGSADYKSGYGAENEHLGPRKNLNRKKSDVAQYSEADYAPDVYKNGSGSHSVPNGIDKSSRRKPSNAKLRSKEEEEEYWIHRDKLAQIESQELEEAGFPVRPSRSGSRSTAGGSWSRQEQHHDGESDLDDHRNPRNHDTKRQRRISPIPAEDDEDGPFDFELRTPAEAAADQEGQYFHSPSTKPGGTKIPMPKLSPMPVPSVIMERDSPLPRSRTSSGTGIQEPRPRSRSMSSQVVLDDDMPRTPMHGRRPSQSSDSPGTTPPKGKGMSKGSASSRRISGQRGASGTSKSRTSSQQARNSPEKRPGTSSGRPSTSHRLEGDPPWLATMYKPDPRLPPDQQMLPTHAKRMAQEKWEKEGKTGTVYDREFRLLNDEEIDRPLDLNFDLEPRKPSNPQNEKGTWPLGSPKSPNQRPGTSGTEHGGYSTIPKISSTPAPTTPQIAQQQEKKEPLRMPEPQEEEVQKKGCCCIVM